MGFECRITSPESPTTKSVPILRPSLPSRAISTASETTCLSTRVLTSRLSEQISSYILDFATCITLRSASLTSSGNRTVKRVPPGPVCR